MLCLAFALVLALFVGRIHRLRPFRIWSPFYLALISYVVLALGGLVMYGFTEAAQGTFYWLPVSRSDLLWTLERLLFLLVLMCLGSLTYLGTRRSRVSPVSRPSPASILPRTEPAVDLTPASMIGVLVLAQIPLFLLLLGVGVSNVWQRSIYLPEQHHMLKILGSSLAMVAVFGSGLIFALGRRPRNRSFRLWGVLILAAYEVVFFSLATRQFAVAPVVFCFGALLAQPRSKWLQFLAALGLLAAPLLIQVPLTLRGLPNQGLSPFLGYMTASTRGFALQVISPEHLRTFLLNTFYGFPLTAYVSSAPHLPLSYFLTSVNPLPGSLTSWYDISPLLRVSVYVPYNSLGELLNYGLLIASPMFFLLGVILAAIDTSIRREVAQGNYLLPALYIGLSVFFILDSTQYNLRSSIRVIYYMLAIALFARILSELRLVSRSEPERWRHGGHLDRGVGLPADRRRS